jgi:hypothetical protein
MWINCARGIFHTKAAISSTFNATYSAWLHCFRASVPCSPVPRLNNEVAGGKLKRRVSVCSIYALALTLATAAIARDDDDGQQRNRNAQIKGQYAFTGTVQCIVSGTPFNANFTPTSFTVSTRGTLVGVLTFDGNGTGTIKIRTVGLNPPPVTNNATTPPTTPLGGSTRAPLMLRETLPIASIKTASLAWTSCLGRSSK